MDDQNNTGVPAEENPPSQTDGSTPPPPPLPSNPPPETELPPQTFPAIAEVTPATEPAPAYAPASTMAPAVETNTLAIVSLVASIASWIIIPGLGSIIGVICGIMARNQIKTSAGRQTGDGLALGGIIVGGINIALICIIVLCFGLTTVAALLGSGNTR